MRRALWATSPVAESRSAISRAARSTPPARAAQATAGSSAPAPPDTTTLTRRGSPSSAGSGSIASPTTRGPSRAAYGERRCSRWAATASSSGASPGGKTAASSTRACRKAGTVDTPATLTHRCRERTCVFAERTHTGGSPDDRGSRAMTYYRRVGEVPAKRHTAFRDDAGALRYEELMGEEGFSSDSSLLYHSRRALGDRGQPGLGAARPDADREPPAQASPPAAPAAVRRDRDGGRTSTPSSTAGSCSATPTCGSPTSWPTPPRRTTATRSATSASTSRPAAAPWRRCSASCPTAPATS